MTNIALPKVKMDRVTMLLAATIAALVAVGLFLQTNGAKLTMLHAGPPLVALRFWGCILGAGALFFYSNYLLSGAEARHTAMLTQQAEQTARLEEERQRVRDKMLADGVVKIDRVEAKMDAMYDIVVRGFLSISTLASVGPKRPYIAGTKTTDHGGVETEDTLITVYDEFGAEQLVVIVHLFRDVAYWRYGSGFEVDGPEGPDRPFNLLDTIRQSSLSAEFARYEYLIGIGLDSNSPQSDPAISFQRASVLCGGLYGVTETTGRTKTLGLSIGTYGGPRRETRQAPDPRQRTVVILGANKIVESVDEQDLIEEILRQVSLSGVDLHLYSELQAGGEPDWIETAACDRRRLLQ